MVSRDMLFKPLICMMQVDLWKKYIQWEKNNPLRTEDHATITKRGKINCSHIDWKNGKTFFSPGKVRIF